MLRIKEAREARGWTQEQLAEAVNTTQQTIQRWESGQTDVKSNQIKAISKALGVTVSFIMNVVEDSSEQAKLSTDEWELIRNYRKCHEGTRSTIRSLASSLSLLPTESEYYYRQAIAEQEEEQHRDLMGWEES